MARVLEAAVAEVELDRGHPKMMVALGRGSRGKSSLLRWVAETSGGVRKLRIIDADPVNRTLSAHFPNAQKPPAVEGDGRREYLEAQFIEQMENADGPASFDIVLDVGANDLLIKHLGGDVRLAETMEGAGVDFVAFHMLGADDEDLTYLTSLEDDNLLKPKKTVLVLNTGLVAASADYAETFKPVVAHKTVQAVLARGGKLVNMPPLPCMTDTKGGSFEAFCANAKNPFNRIRASRWLEQMADFRKKLAGYLP